MGILHMCSKITHFLSICNWLCMKTLLNVSKTIIYNDLMVIRVFKFRTSMRALGYN